jgi:hypothetical protein
VGHAIVFRVGQGRRDDDETSAAGTILCVRSAVPEWRRPQKIALAYTKNKPQTPSAFSICPCVVCRSHTKGSGQRLYELACQLDREGIVAERAKGEDWVKIKNPAYSQKEGRKDLFKRAG